MNEISRIIFKTRAPSFSDEKKRLIIACLKENFTFLDFWEKEGEQAKAAAKELNWHRENDFSALRKKHGSLADEVIEAIKHHYQSNGPLIPVGGWKDHTPNRLEIYNTIHTLFRFDGHLGRLFRLRMWAKDPCFLDAFKAGLADPNREKKITGTPAGFLPALEILDPATRELPENPPFYFYDDVPAISQYISHELPGVPCEAAALDTSYLKPSERLLRVDLSRKKSDLMREFKAFLDQAGEYRKTDNLPKEWADNYQGWKPDTSRERAEAWDQLKVWRMRKERIPFSEIARAMGITQDAAKKAFYRAYEITQGRAYDRERYRKFLHEKATNKDDLAMMCQNCQDKKCYKTGEPCPEILRYADMERVSMKEFIGGEMDLLDDGGIADHRQYQSWKESENFWTR